jgi:hypothetical protein
MRNTLLTAWLVTAATLFLLPGLASAHHGWAAFDPDSTVTLQGTVTDFHFTNPHCVVEFDVKDEKGQNQKWQGELTSLNRLARKGWTAITMEAGDDITVSGYRARNGVLVIRISKIAVKGRDLIVDMGN